MGKHVKDKQEKRKGKKEAKKGKKIGLKIFLIILIIIVIAAIYFFFKVEKNGGGTKGLIATVVGHDATKVENLEKLDFLLLGDNQGLTDSIMVCSYDPKIQEATILSIPRDTFIGKNKNKATGGDKINSLYQGQNPEKVMKKVSEITNIDLQYYVIVETDALIELVDAIGGVQFNVPIDMKYDDPAQDLHINLKEGEQLIDGEKAEQLLRFRHNNNGTSYPMEYGDNDYGRMRTQREFIQAALSQTLKVSNILKITDLLEIVTKNVKTNMTFDLLKDYIPYVVEFKTENLKTGALPGVSQKCNNVWVFIYNQKEAEELIDELFFKKDVETVEDLQNEISDDKNLVNEV